MHCIEWLYRRMTVVLCNEIMRSCLVCLELGAKHCSEYHHWSQGRYHFPQQGLQPPDSFCMCSRPRPRPRPRPCPCSVSMWYPANELNLTAHSWVRQCSGCCFNKKRGCFLPATHQICDWDRSLYLQNRISVCIFIIIFCTHCRVWIDLQLLWRADSGCLTNQEMAGSYKITEKERVWQAHVHD